MIRATHCIRCQPAQGRGSSFATSYAPLSEVRAAAVAKATGYSPGTTTARAAEARTDWASY